MKIGLKLYVIMNTQTFNFLNNNGEEEEKIEFADKHFSIDRAIEEMDKCYTPSDYEIRELDVTYNLGKITR